MTRAPADALGLSDRGQIRPGVRGDLVIVDPDPVPTVTHAIVGGREAYRARTAATE